MKQLINEWRKYLNSEILNEDIAMIMASTEVVALLGEASIRAAENKLVQAFIRAGATDINAKQYVDALRFGIAEAIPNIVDLAATAKPTLANYIAGVLANLASKAPALLPILRGLGRLSVPVAVLGAIKNVYDIQQAWDAFAKTANLSNVKAVDRLRRLRELEDQIKKEGFESIKSSEANTSIKRGEIARYFQEAKKFYPNVVQMFPDVFNLLDPGWKKGLI